MVDQAEREGASDESAGTDPSMNVPSWEVIAQKRRLRARLDEEIARDSYQAILDSREAGVATADLAEQWDVTVTWIYTQAPVRNKSGKTTTRSTGRRGQ